MPDKNRIAKDYSAMLDSVFLIKQLKARKPLSDDEKDIVSCNVAHLELMLVKNFWTTENMTSVKAAVKAGRKLTPLA